MGCIPAKPSLLKNKTQKNQPKKQKNNNNNNNPARSNFFKLAFGLNPVKTKRKARKKRKFTVFSKSNRNKSNIYLKQQPQVRRQSVLMQIISVFEQKLNGLKETEKEDELCEDTTENDQSFSIDSCSENTRLNRINNKNNGENNNESNVEDDDNLSSQYSQTSSLKGSKVE